MSPPQEGGIVGPGNAVVTGFSGFVANEAPVGADPFDYLSINPDGPAAQVIDLSALGPQGQLSDAPKTITDPASQIGQVFGVALDNAPAPNIYLAATSAYGISIYLPDGTATDQARSAPARPAPSSCPASSARPNTAADPARSGASTARPARCCSSPMIESASYGVASLGGLAFDPVSQQLFVADRGTGIIHRFGLDGSERGTYDHGTDGRPAAGLSPLPYVPGPPVDINSAAFDTEDTGDLGLRPAGAPRLRPRGAQQPALLRGRAGPAGLVGRHQPPTAPSAGNPRFEVEVPRSRTGSRSPRSLSTATVACTSPSAARRPATTRWPISRPAARPACSASCRSPPAIPRPASGGSNPTSMRSASPRRYDNANGGVALGYGYQQSGRINYGACRATLWSTGERLLDPGDPSVPPDSYPAIDGLQGNSPSAIEPQNMPPLNAWFVDYDDAAGSPEYRGYMGAIAIYSPCAGQGAYAPPPPVITCPPARSIPAASASSP